METNPKFGDDQKAWFKVDYSKNTYKEAETIHPKRHIDDAAVVFSNYMNDWRNNKPLNNSALLGLLIGLIGIFTMKTIFIPIGIFVLALLMIFITIPKAND